MAAEGVGGGRNGSEVVDGSWRWPEVVSGTGSGVGLAARVLEME